MSKALTLKVAYIERETEDAVTIHLKQPLLRKIRYTAGQYLTLEVDVDGDGAKGCRAYSISSTPGLDKTLSITVKRIAGGKVSNRLVQQLAAGDAVQTLGAHGRFTFAPQAGKRRHLVLFAAGSGITPIFSILKSALHFEADSRVSLIYGNRNTDSVIFRDKLEHLQRLFGERLNLLHVLSQPESPHPHSGRLTRQRVGEILQALPNPPGYTIEYYACGPNGMMDEVTEALQAMGVPAEAVHMESFTPAKASTQPPAQSNAPKQVQLLMQGQEFSFAVPPGQTILEAALANGVQPPFSCRSGFCTACICTKLSGEVEMREDHGLSSAELKMGHALMCIGYPATDDVRLQVE
ncbi:MULTISPECIES: ferredoxin--NADP reductase [unclassified Pseudomonas]|uniref:ferredoxin--NADP reductase n=1 Tax=unclassified Pseudomonas TaxID=196821 RepID=UPI00244B749B|nr:MULTISPECIES: ferredoxin--NADP reductase [unclassified Pseudomonas]MDG9923697.1 ferredoxin--NADP reductase [Pseudomonas sp. GD04045]MDH0036459.1 ferredoxin--NADP reductase [Pseudomonas sp. GD04019]